MKKQSFIFTFLLSFVSGLLLAGCTPAQSPQTDTPAPAPTRTSAPAPVADEVTLVTHDSFDISEDALQQFERTSGIKLNILKSGDAGEMLNTLLLSKDAPLGDVVYGIDNTFLSRALAGNLFRPYAAPALTNIPQRLKLDDQNRLLPVDFGYVTLNYDAGWFEQAGLEPPTDIADLIAPAYKGLTVVENPASSSPGLAFLLTTIWRYGDVGEYTWRHFWKDLKRNDVLVTDGWSAAYFGQFTAGSGGEGSRPIVVSYATSPAAEVFFNELDAPPTVSINTPGNSFEQVEFVGILQKSPHPAAAEKLVDFLLDVSFQQEIPQHQWVYPANSQAPVGDLFQKWAKIPAEPVTLAADAIAQHREQWLEDWTDIMLR